MPGGCREEKTGRRYQKIVATGFLVRRGKVLLVRRVSHETFRAGCYEMPGGKVDFGEDPYRAIEREFREETGLDVRATRLYWSFAYVSHGGKRHTVEILFLVKLKGRLGKIRLSEDHDCSVWAAEDELGKYALSPEIREAASRGFSSGL